jgi:hypothetical protein
VAVWTAVSGGRGGEVLLGNGGRLRLKTASQPEYATPESGRLADMLVPFLVTRQLICGAGRVLRAPQGAVYALGLGPGQVRTGHR